jgi:hypothetical protein
VAEKLSGLPEAPGEEAPYGIDPLPLWQVCLEGLAVPAASLAGGLPFVLSTKGGSSLLYLNRVIARIEPPHRSGYRLATRPR